MYILFFLILVIGAGISVLYFFHLPTPIRNLISISLGGIIAGTLIRSLTELFPQGKILIDNLEKNFEQNDMSCRTAHIRLKVGAKGESLENVRVTLKEIKPADNSIGNYDISETHDKLEFFWPENVKTHVDIDHRTLDSPEKVLEHMGKCHFDSKTTLGFLEKGSFKKVNLIIKIDGIKETFLAIPSARGGAYNNWCDYIKYYSDNHNAEFPTGEFWMKILVSTSTEGVRKQTKIIKFKTGHEIGDLEKGGIISVND